MKAHRNVFKNKISLNRKLCVLSMSLCCISYSLLARAGKYTSNMIYIGTVLVLCCSRGRAWGPAAVYRLTHRKR